MGFLSTLSNIANIVAPIAATALGGPAAGIATTALLPSGGVAAGTALARASQTAQILGIPIDPNATIAGPSAAFGQKNKTLTIVRVVNAAGQTVKEAVLDGRPFMMQKDFVTFKRVKKLIGKASRRLGGGRGTSKKKLEQAERMGLLEGIAVAGNETATALAVLDD